MNIFIINSGSSSIKYQLFRMPDENPVCTGLVERIGGPDARILYKAVVNGEETSSEKTIPVPDHKTGLQQVVALLKHPQTGVISDEEDVDVIGHRVVHGGNYTEAVLVTEEVKKDIRDLFSLAPLHNPTNYTGIEVMETIFPKAKQVVVFDTAFHQTMPEYAFRYAIPNELFAKEKIRVYGFHGISHKYVTGKAAAYLKNEKAKLISIHLGNGCSMAAVHGGICLDTSMGFSPLDGLIMGTRSGSIDPAVLIHLSDKGYSSKDINTLLNKRSGMLGLTGSNDMRDVAKSIEEGSADADTALTMYAYRIQKYIGAYAAVLNGIDAILFTAGVGENDADVRKRVCASLSYFGIQLDETRNRERSASVREISSAQSTVKVLIVPTNEELEIARQAFALLNKPGN